MKILYHHRTQAEDAQGIHISEIVRAFRELRHEVRVVSLVERSTASGKGVAKPSWRSLITRGPHWLYELMAFVYNLYGYRLLCRAIQSQPPNLIYERYSLNTFCGIWASKRFGIPLVLEVNNPLYREQRDIGRLTFRNLARSSERWICSQSTWTIVVSNVLKDILVQQGVPATKMIVMPNGIDPEKFHPAISGEAVRKRWGMEGHLIIGFVGWFRPWHGLDILLEIMRESDLAKNGVRLMLIGEGPAYADLHRYAEKHNLLSVVKFTGPVNRGEIPAHIAAMDIAVQPSAPEYACPMKILEYMAIGKCIVAPDQPNIRELLSDGLNAFLFQRGDKESLRLTLLKLINDPVKRSAAGRSASECIFERRLLWKANAERTLALVFGQYQSEMPKTTLAIRKIGSV